MLKSRSIPAWTMNLSAITQQLVPMVMLVWGVYLIDERVITGQAEGLARKQALQGTLARLQAEATGRKLEFPEEVPEATAQAEQDSYEARQRMLNEAVETGRRTGALRSRELAMAETVSAKGLMSEVEVMRVRRQLIDLQQGTAERIKRLRQKAAGEMVRVRNELALLEEQMVMRDDARRRTTQVSADRYRLREARAAGAGEARRLRTYGVRGAARHRGVDQPRRHGRPRTCGVARRYPVPRHGARRPGSPAPGWQTAGRAAGHDGAG